MHGRSDNRYWIACNRTTNAFERVAQHHPDAFLAGDDLQNYAADKAPRARAQELGQLVFRLSEGETRDRLNGSKVVDFRLAGLLSSNTSIIELMGGTDNATNIATELRLITLPILNTSQGNIFECVPERYTGSRMFVESLVMLTKRYHGTAIREFVQRLVDYRKEHGRLFEHKIREHVARFYEKLDIDPSDGPRSRAAEAFALVAVAGSLAKHFEVLPPSYEPFAIAQECYNRHATVALREARVEFTLQQFAGRAGIINLDSGYPELTDEEVSNVLGFLKTGLKGQPVGKRFLIVPEKGILRLFPGWSTLRTSSKLDGILLGERYRPSKQVKVRQGRKVRCCVFAMP